MNHHTIRTNPDYADPNCHSTHHRGTITAIDRRSEYYERLEHYKGNLLPAAVKGDEHADERLNELDNYVEVKS